MGIFRTRLSVANRTSGRTNLLVGLNKFPKAMVVRTRFSKIGTTRILIRLKTHKQISLNNKLSAKICKVRDGTSIMRLKTSSKLLFRLRDRFNLKIKRSLLALGGIRMLDGEVILSLNSGITNLNNNKMLKLLIGRAS